MTIDDLKFDERNFNLHTEKGMRLLEKSVKEHKFGRSILVDKNNNIIAGNGVAETAKKLNGKIKVVETTGDELVVVKRNDVDLDSPQGREMALADNAVSAANLNWDIEELEKANSDFDLDMADWGVKPPMKKQTDILSEIDYKTIYYDAKRTPDMKLSDCLNMDKYKAKIEYIDSLNIDEKVKEVLRLCACRFIKIDFEAIADYYVYNASDEEKKAIERLRMVIIDNGQLGGFIEDDLLRITKITAENG